MFSFDPFCENTRKHKKTHRNCWQWVLMDFVKTEVLLPIAGGLSITLSCGHGVRFKSLRLGQGQILQRQTSSEYCHGCALGWSYF